MLRDARQRANGHRSVHDDLSRIEAYVRGGLDRSDTRGLAIFACADSNLWEVIELPVPVRSRVVINHAPAVGQLESVVQEHESIGVLLADRQRARLFVFELGRLLERTELIDELPRDYDQRGQQRARHAASTTSRSWPTSTCAMPPRPPSTCGRRTGSSTSPSARPTPSPASWRARSTRTCSERLLRSGPRVGGCQPRRACGPRRRSIEADRRARP